MALNTSAGFVPTGGGAWETHDATYGKGGWRAVANNTARDAITTARRSSGMLVYNIATGVTYVLGAGLTNGDWAVYTAASAAGSVTLAMMANMATDSLIGRDTAASGVPEVIGLNATLSMTGSGSLQRAALTGAITASAGSNTTAFGTGAFGAINIVTTGFVSIGTTPATAGALRLAHASIVYGRNSANSGNIQLLDWGVGTADVFRIGDATATTTINGSSALTFESGSATRMTVGTNISLYTTVLRFKSTVVTPSITQETDSTNSVTGDKLTIQAQSCDGTTSTGGDMDIAPGAGTSAGGLARLTTGAIAQRFAWNDTGIGFYATAPVARPADMGALTDSTGGTANGTLVDVGAVFTQATLNDNFADLAAKVTAIRNALRTLGLMA